MKLKFDKHRVPWHRVGKRKMRFNRYDYAKGAAFSFAVIGFDILETRVINIVKFSLWDHLQEKYKI